MHIHMDLSVHVYSGMRVVIGKREIFAPAAISREKTRNK